MSTEMTVVTAEAATYRVREAYFHPYSVRDLERSCLRVGTLLRLVKLWQATTYDCAGVWHSTMGTYEVLDGDHAGRVVMVAHGSDQDLDGPVIAEHPGLTKVQ